MCLLGRCDHAAMQPHHTGGHAAMQARSRVDMPHHCRAQMRKRSRHMRDAGRDVRRCWRYSADAYETPGAT
eukprot:363401-Chlamydomonas_euryale.AAC.2